MALATKGDDPRRETGQEAYRRIARRKLLERGTPPERIKAELERMMRTDVPFRFDLSEAGDRPTTST